MLAIFNSLNAHYLPIFQPILMILVSKFMVYRVLSDKTYLSLGLLSPLIAKEMMASHCSSMKKVTLQPKGMAELPLFDVHLFLQCRIKIFSAFRIHSDLYLLSLDWHHSVFIPLFLNYFSRAPRVRGMVIKPLDVVTVRSFLLPLSFRNLRKYRITLLLCHRTEHTSMNT